MKTKIENIIFQALQNLAEELENENLKSPNIHTNIYGVDGNLDSLALVSFITDLEEMIEQNFDKNITLADEKAMSSKNSPFKNVESLSQYINTLLQS